MFKLQISSIFNFDRAHQSCISGVLGVNTNAFDLKLLRLSSTAFPHIRPAGIIFSHSLQMRVLLEKNTFSLHKSIRNAGIIRGRVLYEEIRYIPCTALSND
jgi:hypothetical protein